MRRDLIASLTTNFEACAHEDNGVEFWLARDLQELLGYGEWRNFTLVIDKARTACTNAGHPAADHFVDATKMVDLGSGAQREIDDIMLTRYACYLIAQNGDPRKEQIAFAMNYFAVQTRKQELIEQRIRDWERLQARAKLSLSEKELSGVIFERGVDDKGFAIIRSKGDQALFGGHTTQDMKRKLSVPAGRALADFLPTITIKAKDFANEITIFNVRRDDGMRGAEPIAAEHVRNSKAVRELLRKRGICPEELPPDEDAQKLKRRVASEDKRLPKTTKKLPQNKANGK